MGDRMNFPNSPGPIPAPPMVYVHDQTVWEYKVITRDVAQSPNEQELNALGKDGWELAVVLPCGGAVHFYFKRLKD